MKVSIGLDVSLRTFQSHPNFIHVVEICWR